MADSRIKSASEILSAFFDQELVKQGEYYALFDRSWKNIAGARLAPHSRPTEIKHGVLFVETEHQGWMQLLQLQQDKMLSEIQRRFPDLGVRSMAFRLGDTDGLEKNARSAGAAMAATKSEPLDRARAAAMSEAPDAKVPKSPSSALPGELQDLFEKIRKNIRR
jgi:hypothetical protein